MGRDLRAHTMLESVRHTALAFAACTACTACTAAGTEAQFESDVIPILERRCAALSCHGVGAGEDREGLELHPDLYLTLEVDEARRIRDVSAALTSVKAKINSLEDVELSTLLRKPLPPSQGGLSHFATSVFSSREDAEWTALRDWAATVEDGGEGLDQPELDAFEALFRDTVYPTLIRKGCAVATCHGSLGFAGASFVPPGVPDSLLSSRASLRATYHEARRNLALGGDLRRSRLLRKMLPVEQGGIAHKGGNDVFMAGAIAEERDPFESAEISAILAWAELEQGRALFEVEDGLEPPPAAPPLVFVGGPIAPAGPFEVPSFTPGTDLFRLDAPWDQHTPINLSRAHHDGPADIRDPAVSHDGRWLAFAMRRSPADAHNIYLLRTDGTALQQLTFDASDAKDGLITANFSPVFGPADGTHFRRTGKRERIYFVSSRDRESSDRSALQNTDLYAIDLDGQNLERLTHTPVAEVAPSFVSSGEFSGTLLYTIQRAATGVLRGSLFRFPVDHNGAHHLQPEAHPHFGISQPIQIFYGMKELPDGRGAVTLFNEGNVWRGGQLAIVDRQLAVEVPEHFERLASVPGFRHAMAVLTASAALSDISEDGFWRDPAPLPDGSLLAVHGVGPLDLDDAGARPETELVRLVLAEDRATDRPRIERVELLLGRAHQVSQPTALHGRPFEDDLHERAWSDDAEPALLVHSGVQVNEALIGHLPPLGLRTFRSDLTGLRFSAPVVPLIARPVPSSDTRIQKSGATTLSLTGRAPLYLLAEVPIEADGSVSVHLPARQAIKLSTIDAAGMAIGASHHHWSAPLAGEQVPAGISPLAYATRCGGCHGAVDGRPGSVLQPPVDALTQASVTAARFEGRDRRRPIPPRGVDRSRAVYVDFRRDVQPILDRRCANAGCHSGGAPAAGLSLTRAPTRSYNDAYESLLVQGAGSGDNTFAYVDAEGQRARASFLIELLLGRELEAPRAICASCPPHGSPPLTPEEALTIARWIELGAAYRGLPDP